MYFIARTNSTFVPTNISNKEDISKLHNYILKCLIMYKTSTVSLNIKKEHYTRRQKFSVLKPKDQYTLKKIACH